MGSIGKRESAFAAIPALREKWRAGEASGDEIRACRALMAEKEVADERKANRAEGLLALKLLVPGLVVAVILGRLDYWAIQVLSDGF